MCHMSETMFIGILVKFYLIWTPHTCLQVKLQGSQDCIASSTMNLDTSTLNGCSSAPIGQNDPGPFSTALATKTLFGTFLHSSIFFSGLHCFHFHVTKNWHLSFKPPEGVQDEYPIFLLIFIWYFAQIPLSYHLTALKRSHFTK